MQPAFLDPAREDRASGLRELRGAGEERERPQRGLGFEALRVEPRTPASSAATASSKGASTDTTGVIGGPVDRACTCSLDGESGRATVHLPGRRLPRRSARGRNGRGKSPGGTDFLTLAPGCDSYR